MMRSKDLIKIDDFTKIFTELSRNTELWKVFEDYKKAEAYLEWLIELEEDM